MSDPFKSSDWEKAHQVQLDAFKTQTEALFHQAADEAILMVLLVNPDPGQPFTFRKHPTLTDRIKTLLTRLAEALRSLIGLGTAAAWERANAKNDAWLTDLVQNSGLLPELATQYRGVRNAEALATFQTRRTAGLNLSQRVFNYTGQFKRDLETCLTIGIQKGQSAAQLGQAVRGYLREPDRLYHRVRNEQGKLVLSRPAKAYHPGQGTYRSSYKNALRLTASEINMAYRTADHLRYQTLDFVVGIEVRRSNRNSNCDVCGALAGRYPKTYVFRGNHPFCRCYAVSILMTPAELQALGSRFLSGDTGPVPISQNQVSEVHASYREWIDENKKRLSKANNLPLFITDNLTTVPELSFLRLP